MKSILLLTSVSLFFFTATCNNQTSNNKSMDATTSIEVEGTIEAIGMTSWQYGTHTLTNDENFYALRSKTVKLDQYEGKTVTIVAQKIDGYPVDGGPEFLEVLSIKD
ncbi:MAG TPA: hypothetical protein VLN72_08785 [Gillisia sp.]|nr:hypothetical protein [Gillisia sp.]